MKNWTEEEMKRNSFWTKGKDITYQNNSNYSPFPNHLKAHCYVVTCTDRDGNKYILLGSYSTYVLCVDVKNQRIHVSGLYSMTTRKHIGWFMNYFFKGKYNYYDIKKAYESGEAFEYTA